MTSPSALRLGLRENLPQFILLIIVNAFVGAMVGMERSVLPLVAEQIFGLASRNAILTFIVSFGVVKAVSNLFAGARSDRIGRKRLLLLGWIAGLPVPFMLMWGTSWGWIVAANVFLGINQGLCWSMTVIMKIDLAGPKRRGLAMGLNEFSGYVAVALAAYFSGALAMHYGLRPVPFTIGIGAVFAGLLLSLVFVKDTRGHAQLESAERPSKPFKEVFLLTSWRDSSLFSCSQAGLVNNLNDGMAWGLFPLLYVSLGYSVERIGMLAGLYPMTWGISQLFTGALSDRFGRKWMITIGMWVQALGLVLVGMAADFGWQIAAAILLGFGTAMVYPTLLAAIGDGAKPEWRASAVGVYRLWRDLGYAVGAVLSGIIADIAGTSSAVAFVGMLTFISGCLVAWKFSHTQPASTS